MHVINILIYYLFIYMYLKSDILFYGFHVVCGIHYDNGSSCRGDNNNYNDDTYRGGKERWQQYHVVRYAQSSDGSNTTCRGGNDYRQQEYL